MSEKGYLLDDYKDPYEYCRRLQHAGLSDFPPLVVTCAITGANQGKEANPNLPETKEEQVQSAYDAYNAGASQVHIHCRSKQDPSVMTADYHDYEEVNAAIRAKCPDLIINNTVAGGRYVLEDGKSLEDPQRKVAVPARAEVMSIDVANFAIAMSRKDKVTGERYKRYMTKCMSLRDCEELYGEIVDAGAKPEFELFDISGYQYLKHLASNGYLNDSPHLVSFMATPWGSFPTMEYLQSMIHLAPANSVMSVGAIGAIQFPYLAMCIAQGLHVRVGMEDSVYISRGELATSNAQLVEKIVKLAELMGRRIATPAEAREILGLGVPRAF